MCFYFPTICLLDVSNFGLYADVGISILASTNFEDKEVRKQFVSSISSKFRRYPKASEYIEKEWLLFTSAIVLSVVVGCGRKRLEVAGDSEEKYLGATKRLKKQFDRVGVLESPWPWPRRSSPWPWPRSLKSSKIGPVLGSRTALSFKSLKLCIIIIANGHRCK